MAVKGPFPELDELLASIGEEAQRIATIDAAEGAAGNISVCVGWPIEIRHRFPLAEEIPLPQPASHLTGRVIIVTGSGRRLGNIQADPAANVGIVRVNGDGTTGILFTSPRRMFDRPTSEWNSHLGVHDDTVGRTGTDLHAVVHAQPPHLTYLSQVPAYRDEERFNRRLLRWHPETIVHLPGGIGVLPFMLPASRMLMEANVEALRTHRIVVWSKHGVMSRSGVSLARAVDRIEYAETAARYEYMDLVGGERAEGLTLDEMRAVVEAFDVKTTIV
jgi:rhamnulose-1-phosphate aldolase